MSLDQSRGRVFGAILLGGFFQQWRFLMAVGSRFVLFSPFISDIPILSSSLLCCCRFVPFYWTLLSLNLTVAVEFRCCARNPFYPSQQFIYLFFLWLFSIAILSSKHKLCNHVWWIRFQSKLCSCRTEKLMKWKIGVGG